jgi:sugar/nucleoside kinase (ribokinase family)
LKEEGVDTRFVVTDKTHETNRHYVLWYETERTILVNHQEYPYSFPRLMIPPKWIYLSSLAPHSLPYHEEILAYLLENPKVKLAFQPGTFQMSLPEPLASNLYKRSDLFFCNKR